MSGNTSTDADESSDEHSLPATGTITPVAEETYQVTLCGGDYANIIVDLKNDEQLDPELRVYPSSHPTDAENRHIISLPGYNPASNVEPQIKQKEGESDSLVIRLPTDDPDTFVSVVTIETTAQVPYIIVDGAALPGVAEDGDTEFRGYVVHTTPGDQHSHE